MTGMVTASMMRRMTSGSDMRATPPAARMSAGTRSSAMTAQAPASSAILACSGVTTSMMTPPLSIWARPRLTVSVPVSMAMGLTFLRWLRTARWIQYSSGQWIVDSGQGAAYVSWRIEGRTRPSSISR